MNSQIEHILKSGNEDHVIMSLSHYEQMKDIINNIELENAKLKRKNADLIAFIEQLGIPSGIKIIPSSISSKTVHDSMDSYIEYHVKFLVNPRDVVPIGGTIK